MALLLSNPVNLETGCPTIPKWLASHLLVTEALLLLGEEPRSVALPKEDEPVPQEQLNVGPSHQEARSRIFEFCMRLISMHGLPRDELLAALRLFVLLTRDHAVAVEFVKRDGIPLLFRLLKSPSTLAEANSTHPYIAAILRHVIEDPATVQHIMRLEIKSFFSHPRTRAVEIGLFVRSCSAMALRDSATFIQITTDMCKLSSPYNTVKNISLKADPKPTELPLSKDDPTDMQIDSPVSTRATATSESLESLVHFLIAELIKSVKTDHVDAATGTTPKGPELSPEITHVSADPPNANQTVSSSTIVDPAYPCFVMQCLTELLFSYDSCKVAFLSYSPKKRTQTPAKDSATKHRTAALQFLISELMSFGTINPAPPPEAKQQIMPCNWAMSVVVALCVDTAPTEIKDVPHERASVRKFVLEAINRAIKDLPSEAGEARYSRLLALADLCYRLLTVRFNSGTRKSNDDSPTHISKVMLEKNFVATLTNALADVDPNFPNIRGVVTGILRPLEYLFVIFFGLVANADRELFRTKIAIKMSRPSDKHKETPPEEPENNDSDLSEEDDDTDDVDAEETPDLYRNSSLGMYVSY